jgi:Fuc2NAc and GlcNAc transferase
MIASGVVLAAVGISMVLTQAIRWYAVSRSIIDVPNARSLHEEPVPRGGGLAMVVTFLAGIVLLAGAGSVPVAMAVGIVGGGGVVALIGWFDDYGHVLRTTRVLTHVAAAAWALFWLGGLPSVSLGSVAFHLPVVGTFLALVGVVWWINLYNFMDGIDGLAAGQAVSVAAAAWLLMLLTNAPASLSRAALLLAASAAGFLAVNWTPARIFMGDVGSGFLGFTFAILAIASENAGALPVVVWVLLSGVFVFDSTVTLLRRVMRREAWWEAHRSHAYQRLVSAGYSHVQVTCAVLAFNLIIATIVYIGVVYGMVIPAAVVVLVLLVLAYGWIEHVNPMSAAASKSAAGGADIL